jgi:two-component system, chemotaxis family, chemotaxis protein CheY
MKISKVLVVDDSPTMRQLLGFSIKRIPGVLIVEAKDGMEALKCITADTFDLALVDINMPIMDGLKLIYMIREEEKLLDLPIVVITTEGGEKERERALELGANAYLTKPVQGSDVLAMAKKFLEVGGG